MVADLSTRAERGKYIGYAIMGVTLGPAIGPVLGGIIDQKLGWHWTFWILTIYAAVLLIIIIAIFPETCRSVCGDGTVPPQRWNRTVYEMYCQSRKIEPGSGNQWKGREIHPDSITPQRFRPRPWNVLRIAMQKEAGIILGFGGIMYAGYMMVLITLTSELQARYGLDALQIGLCYLPIGLGSLTSRWTMGILLDRNFKRQARRQGLSIVANRQQNIDAFNIEQARLQITFPFLLGGCFATIAYCWVMQFKASLAAPLVLLCFVGHFTTGSFSSLNTLIVDTNRESPATATASSNLFRCLLGAGATAAGTPLIKQIGIGWTGLLITGVWVLASPALYLVYLRGMHWRAQARNKVARRTQADLTKQQI